MAALSELRLLVETSRANYPTVRILIDGEDRLGGSGEIGNDPADLLDTGALLPRTPPLRIALYGCGCGEFGCFCVAPLITEADGVVRWSDFCTVTGDYHSALPSNGPDPAADPEGMARRLRLPDLAFDAAAYRAEVARATTDRNWETRPRAVVRRMRALAPDWTLWPAAAGDVVTVVGHRGWAIDEVELTLPPGPADAVANSLADLLSRHHPGEIRARGLWRAP